MTEERTEPINTEMFRHPLIRQLGELASELLGMRLLIVYPTSSGWSQIHGDARTDLQPEFCRLFQSTQDGAKHCRMCHILMSVAASSGAATVQRCHAGASVVVCPAGDVSGGSCAVVSSCTFADAGAWKETRIRGAKLGIDTTHLREAFLRLPKLGKQQRLMLESMLKAMSHAVEALRHTTEMETRIKTLERGSTPGLGIDHLLKDNDWVRGATRRDDHSKPSHGPLLIRVVSEIVRQRPDLPLTVKELAAAAGVTPNHFTTLFHRSVGQPFLGFLTERRLERAKQLLGDVTLNVNEIARLVGYSDPGYFARLFRKRTGLSPLQWRDRRQDHSSPLPRRKGRHARAAAGTKGHRALQKPSTQSPKA